MEDYQVRVVKEKEELDEKLQSLAEFVKGGVFDKLEDYDKVLLLDQLHYMRGYSSVLEERISYF